jgi:hypothetical protein
MSWQPYSGPEFFRYSQSILADILSKREYVYRNYFSSKGYKMSLPNYLAASPNHPLMTELKSLTYFSDPKKYQILKISLPYGMSILVRSQFLYLLRV